MPVQMPSRHALRFLLLTLDRNVSVANTARCERNSSSDLSPDSHSTRVALGARR